MSAHRRDEHAVPVALVFVLMVLGAPAARARTSRALRPAHVPAGAVASPEAIFPVEPVGRRKAAVTGRRLPSF